MAIITELKEGFKSRFGSHSKTSRTFYIIPTKDGKSILQIDTTGSDDREMPGKVSQSLQFSPEAIQQLKSLLERL